MNKLKKISILSVLFLAIFCVKIYASSDFEYKLDASGNATITAYKGNETDLTIPSTIDGHNVVKIGSHAFDESRNSTNGDTIKNLVIPEGIVEIEGWAFCKCDNLETVKLPESLTTLDWQIFLGCEKLKTINIPHNLTSLSQGFLWNTGIEEITIPENIEKFIGSEFCGCKNLKKAFIYNDNINYYNNGYDTNVFEGCDLLVLYGNKGSTTEAYAKEKGITFKDINEEDDDDDDNDINNNTIDTNTTGDNTTGDNNTINTNTNTNTVENEPVSSTTSSQSNGKLPYTGQKTIVGFIIISIVLMCVLYLKKEKYNI